jgi:hypothetical protein
VSLALLVACGGGGAGDDIVGDDDVGDDAAATGDDPDATPAILCAPSAGGPLWLEEGGTLTATVGCGVDGGEPGAAGFVIEDLPTGATFDGATGALSFTPGLDQAAVYHLRLSAPSLGETGELVVGVADKFDDPSNLPVDDPLLYTEEYGLPVFFLSQQPAASAYEAATVTYGGQDYVVQAKLRGASSLGYPKKSFTIDFSGNKLDDPERGFLEEKKIVLTSTFDDNSYLRAQLTWELWNRLEPTIQVNSKLVVLYVGGVYHGIYAAMDHIDDELMDSQGLPEAGNLYKAVNHDANFKTTKNGGGAKTTMHDGYEKKHGDPAADFSDLDALVTFVSGADDATFALELGERVEVGDFEAWWMLVSFLKLNDSAGKNSYLHHSTLTPWHVVPWDFNDSMGQSWQTLRQGATPIGTYYSNNRLFERLRTHAGFAPALAARLDAALATGGAFDLAWVQDRIDELAAELEPSALRDERKWRTQYLNYGGWKTSRNNAGDWTSFAGDGGGTPSEVDYVKTWLTARHAAMLAL